jgi:hypothetical protein
MSRKRRSAVTGFLILPPDTNSGFGESSVPMSNRISPRQTRYRNVGLGWPGFWGASAAKTTTSPAIGSNPQTLRGMCNFAKTDYRNAAFAVLQFDNGTYQLGEANCH